MRNYPRLRRRLLPFVFWSIPALLLSVLASKEGHRDFHQALIIEGLPFLYWGFVTPGIIGLARRFPPETLKTLRGLAAHCGAAFLLGLVCGLLSALTFMAFSYELPNEPVYSYMLKGLFFWGLFGFLFYTAIVSVGFTIASQERLRERERASAQLEANLVEAQLSALRMQLHPHFLFNALNTVAMQVREGDRDTSVRILTRLSELLRHLLDGSAAQEIPLRTEIEQIERYLEIERARFSDRLRVSIDIPEELDVALVPNFMLQPLVENAIRHGISARAASGRLDIRASRDDGTVTVEVINDGMPLREGFKVGSTIGVGLRNTALRLQHLYGDRGALTLDNRDGLVVARLTFPYHTSPNPA